MVILHGVNVVYKHSPYEVTVDPGQPNSFSAADAAHIAAAGFNVVRLGIVGGPRTGVGPCPIVPLDLPPRPPGRPAPKFNASIAHAGT